MPAGTVMRAWLYNLEGEEVAASDEATADPDGLAEVSFDLPELVSGLWCRPDNYARPLPETRESLLTLGLESAAVTASCIGSVC